MRANISCRQTLQATVANHDKRRAHVPLVASACHRRLALNEDLRHSHISVYEPVWHYTMRRVVGYKGHLMSRYTGPHVLRGIPLLARTRRGSTAINGQEPHSTGRTTTHFDSAYSIFAETSCSHVRRQCS